MIRKLAILAAPLALIAAFAAPAFAGSNWNSQFTKTATWHCQTYLPDRNDPSRTVQSCIVVAGRYWEGVAIVTNNGPGPVTIAIPTAKTGWAAGTPFSSFDNVTQQGFGPAWDQTAPGIENSTCGGTATVPAGGSVECSTGTFVEPVGLAYCAMTVLTVDYMGVQEPSSGPAGYAPYFASPQVCTVASLHHR